MKIIVSEEIESVCPTFVGACVEARVENTPYSKELWDEINSLGEKYKETLTTESLKEISGIAATRKVYRACGKDPSRYRPASEALIRRMLQGKELYQRDTLVDLVNLASIAYGYSIGGFDADKFEGDTLTLGVGKADEPYEGIGRGIINIEGLPVYRDKIGGVGTPTSDNERTKMTIDTTHLVVLINGYDGDEQHVRENAEFILELLKKYCKATKGAILFTNKIKSLRSRENYVGTFLSVPFHGKILPLLEHYFAMERHISLHQDSLYSITSRKKKDTEEFL